MIIAAGAIGGGVGSLFLLLEWRGGLFAGTAIALILVLPVINYIKALELQASARRIREETRSAM